MGRSVWGLGQGALLPVPAKGRSAAQRDLGSPPCSPHSQWDREKAASVGAGSEAGPVPPPQDYTANV